MCMWFLVFIRKETLISSQDPGRVLASREWNECNDRW